MAKKKKKSKHDRYAEAAEELNKVLGLEPPIETEGVDTDVLGEKLLEAKALLYEEDEITKGTEKVLNFLSAQDAKAVEESDEDETEDKSKEVAQAPPKKKEKKESKKEPADEAEEAELEVLHEKVASATKRKTLLQIAMGSEFFKPLEDKLPELKSMEALQGAMLDMFDGEESTEAASEETAPEKDAPKKKSSKKSKKKKVQKEAEEAEEVEEDKPAPKPKKKKGKKSNKAIVYEAWDGGETDAEKLHKKIDGAVKLSTVKSWTNAWDKGKNLPAIAK